MKLRTILSGMGVALALVGASVARAGGNDSLLEMLVRKGIITDKERKELQEEMDRDLARTMERAEKTKVSSWIDQMKWSGDVRLRAEYFDNDDQSNPNDRWRFRYRFRLGMEAKFVDWATVGFRLASGDASDPVSTNETFDDSFQKDPIQIDAAYVIVQPPGWDWLKVTGGKMNNPIWAPAFNSPLIYDGDVTPEGVAEQIAWKFGSDNRHTLFLNAGQFLINEISSSADTDGFLYDVQGGAEFKFGQDPKKPRLSARVLGGFFVTQNADQGAITSDAPNAGNAITASGSTTNYLADFEVVHVGGEIAWQVCDRPFLRTPAIVTVSGQYVKNMADAFDTLSGATTNLAPDQTEGYAGQVAFGGNKKKGEWQVAYQYKHLEADAVWDQLTDSDWGNGGTDRRGHVIKATYNFQEWWQVGLTAFITEKISNRTAGGNTVAGDGSDLLRVQIDNVWKF